MTGSIILGATLGAAGIITTIIELRKLTFYLLALGFAAMAGSFVALFGFSPASPFQLVLSWSLIAFTGAAAIGLPIAHMARNGFRARTMEAAPAVSQRPYFPS